MTSQVNVEPLRIELLHQEPRPYFQESWDGLKAIGDANWSAVAVLQSVLSELKFRRVKRAREVREAVTNRLEELSRERFIWPSTAIRDAKKDLEEGKFPWSDGLLAALGYQVGQKGAYTVQRIAILDYVYESDKIPRVNSAEYMAEWGKAKTAKRLKKLADSLAASIRHAKGQSASMALAITQWEEDLAHLKKTYYDGRYAFSWPSPLSLL